MDTNRTRSPDASSTDAAFFPSFDSADGFPDPFYPADPPGPVSSEVERPVSSELERPVSSEVEKRVGWIEGHMPELVDPLTPSEPENAFTQTRTLRHDGWTPEKKRSFLERFAECGVIVEACEAAGMSARSAYNLRDRDPLFAAGWDAASVKARTPLADEAYSRARNGVVERIYKDGIVVAERHRYDNRLTMAVLTRLDARIDKAEEKGAAHLAVAARWDEYLDAIAEDRQEDGMALLAPAPETPPQTVPAENAGHRELHELCEGEEELEAGTGVVEDEHMLWEDDDHVWWTDYPPPPDFDGDEIGEYGDPNYSRTLSEAEQAVIDEDQAEEKAAALEAAAAQRDRYFGFAWEEGEAEAPEEDGARSSDAPISPGGGA
jgi:hypothetical protein